MVTLKEVADAAGVSFKTVSRVVNRDQNVAEATRARVQAEIERLGYRPNFAARHMRTQRSRVIGFLTDEIATTPFAVDIIKGAQATAWIHGLLLLVVSAEPDDNRAHEAVELMLAHNVEGVIYATMRHRLFDPLPNLYEVSTVLANCRVVDASLPSVVPDEVRGGYEATLALIRAGRRRIAFINLDEGVPAAQGRLIGFRRALAEHDLPFHPELLSHADGQPGLGYLQARSLMALPEPPDAIFCGNDRMAMGAYDALKEAGIRIPQDVSIVGFDNHDVIAGNLRPALSTMALPHYEMGCQAVELLLRQSSADAAIPPEQVLLPCPFVPRESI